MVAAAPLPESASIKSCSWDCYLRGRCRCGCCVTAASLYREQNREQDRPPPFIPAHRARNHVEALLDAGLTVFAISEAAAVSQNVVDKLLGNYGMAPTKRVRRATESKLLAVRTPALEAEERHAAGYIGEPSFAIMPEGVDLSWKADAKCNDPSIDPGIFFPLRGDRKSLAAARKVCRPCPVKEACLQLAMLTDSQGVWAGTTEQEREKMRGRRGGTG